MKKREKQRESVVHCSLTDGKPYSLQTPNLRQTERRARRRSRAPSALRLRSSTTSTVHTQDQTTRYERAHMHTHTNTNGYLQLQTDRQAPERRRHTWEGLQRLQYLVRVRLVVSAAASHGSEENVVTNLHRVRNSSFTARTEKLEKNKAREKELNVFYHKIGS